MPPQTVGNDVVVVVEPADVGMRSRKDKLRHLLPPCGKRRLVSRATATEIMPLFEVKSIDELKSKISEMRCTWKECSASRCGLEFGGIEGINIEPEDIATRP